MLLDKDIPLGLNMGRQYKHFFFCRNFLGLAFALQNLKKLFIYFNIPSG